MTKGTATLWLELDKTRGVIRDWDRNYREHYYVERTGWKRFLTKMLWTVEAQYDVTFEFVPRTDHLPVGTLLPLCDGARLKATVTWVTL